MLLLWTIVTYLLKKCRLNMELNMILIVLIEFAYIIDIPELYSRFNEYHVV